MGILHINIFVYVQHIVIFLPSLIISQKTYDAFYLTGPIISINRMYKSRKDPLINLFDIAIVISLGIITHHFSTARNILFIYLLHCTGLHKAVFIQVYNLLYINFFEIYSYLCVYVSMGVCTYVCQQRNTGQMLDLMAS